MKMPSVQRHLWPYLPPPTCGRLTPPSRNLRSTIPFCDCRSAPTNANKWRGEWAADDLHVTPLLADVSLLSKRGVQVHGVVGGYDILSPDAVLFRDKCARAGVKGDGLDWDKQMHCFPLAWNYKLPESVAAMDWILDVLRRS